MLTMQGDMQRFLSFRLQVLDFTGFSQEIQKFCG